MSCFFLQFQPQADAKVNGTTLSSPSTSLQRSGSSQPMLLRVVGSQTSETMGKIKKLRLSQKIIMSHFPGEKTLKTENTFPFSSNEMKSTFAVIFSVIWLFTLFIFIMIQALLLIVMHPVDILILNTKLSQGLTSENKCH